MKRQQKLWIKQCEKVIGTEEAKYIKNGVETPFMEYKYLQNKTHCYTTAVSFLFILQNSFHQ